MSGKRLVRIVRIGALALLALLALLEAAGVLASLYISGHIDSPIYAAAEAVPLADVAIVLGAGMRRGGTQAVNSKERVAAAVTLYRKGRVKKLLMTSAGNLRNGNEPAMMRDLAVSLGVPEAAIELDGHGYRTYDSIYRARNVYNIDRAVIVTHGYHLNRSLFLAEHVGLDAVGFSADAPGKRYWLNKIREHVASLRAIADVYFSTSPREVR